MECLPRKCEALSSNPRIIKQTKKQKNNQKRFQKQKNLFKNVLNSSDLKPVSHYRQLC
jgi:hypothetical protein